VILQLARFGVVGVAAMTVHWLVVMVLVPLGLLPLIANMIAFAIAFNVSYIGHRNWTFASAIDRAPHRTTSSTTGHAASMTDHATPTTDRATPIAGHATTLKRFFLVSFASFALNEFLYYLLLRFTALDYRSALAIVLIAVAALTFVMSRCWAFRPA
jgi:putative flippase GtrA